MSLEDLAARNHQEGARRQYDVETPQCDILKGGIGSRAQAELLIALDRTVESVHFSWPRYFASALAEFVVWGSGPAGYIDADKAEWVLPLLAGEGATSRATRALAAIAEEAECFDEAFFAGPGNAVPGEPWTASAGRELAQAA